MSGHSKWSTIKRQKGAADAKRSNLFTKLANAVTVAARNGADPALNFQLRLAIDRARANNMPAANIERAIARAQGGSAQNIEEILYEAYGAQGVAILIAVATDNRNRTIASIKAVLNKFGGTCCCWCCAISFRPKRRNHYRRKKRGRNGNGYYRKRSR